MTVDEIDIQLRNLNSDTVRSDAELLVEKWESSGVGIEAVEPVLKFMETHPEWDFGAPGPLVHFVEQFYGAGYEKLLIESLHRHPTLHTGWMLNRIINGEQQNERKMKYLDELQIASKHDLADLETREELVDFLRTHSNS